MKPLKSKFTLELHDVTLENLNLVGGKNASLGEMIRNLSGLGIAIPHGFAITADAYWEFLKFNDLEKSMRKIIGEIDIKNLIALRKGGSQVRQLIRNGKLGAVVRNPNYRGVTVDFWKRLAGVGKEQASYGTAFCGKGEPNQVIRVGHASPPCLFRGVDVFGGQS